MKKDIVDFDTASENPNFPEVTDVFAEEVAKKKGQVHLVDVRRDEELNGELGHIPGMQHILLDKLAMNIAQLPKDETIVFVCRSGVRSAHAATFAKQSGFKHVYNMQGGMIRWNELGFEVER